MFWRMILTAGCCIAAAVAVGSSGSGGDRLKYRWWNVGESGPGVASKTCKEWWGRIRSTTIYACTKEG